VLIHPLISKEGSKTSKERNDLNIYRVTKILVDVRYFSDILCTEYYCPYFPVVETFGVRPNFST
jgi:hypothetical protein